MSVQMKDSCLLISIFVALLAFNCLIDNSSVHGIGFGIGSKPGFDVRCIKTGRFECGQGMRCRPGKHCTMLYCCEKIIMRNFLGNPIDELGQLISLQEIESKED